VSITNRLNFWRSSAAKSIGVAAALAVFAGFLTPSSASATGDDINVVTYVTGNSTADICVNFNNNDGIPSYVWTDEDHFGNPLAVRNPGDAQRNAEYISDYGLSLDTANSDYNGGSVPSYHLQYVDDFTGYGSNDADSYSCDILFAASNIDTFNWNTINFKYRAWTEHGSNNDAPSEGTTQYGNDPEDYYDWYSNDIDHNYWDSENDNNQFSTAVGLANMNNWVRDERHTAFFCISNDEYYRDWDYIGHDVYYYANINYIPTVKVIDDTTGEDVTGDVSIDGGWGEDFPNNNSFTADCGDYETGFLIGDLTLGHTYHFEAAVESYYFEEQRQHNFLSIGDWYHNGDYEYWSTVSSQQFTPLDVRQNQMAIYEPNNNDGCDGPICGSESGPGFVGDAISYDGWNANSVTMTNVDVVLPQSIADDYNYNEDSLGYAYQDTYAWFDVIDAQGDGSWFEEGNYDSFADANGGWYRDNNGYWSAPYYQEVTYAGQQEDKAVTIDSFADAYNITNQVYGTQQTGDFAYYQSFDGQAFVNADINDGSYDGIYQGLSDSYSTNWQANWDATSVRATSTTSIELNYQTGFTTNQRAAEGSGRGGDVESYLRAEQGIYYVRAVPNYGSHAQHWWTQNGFTGVWNPYNDALYGDPGQDSGMDNFSGDENWAGQNRYGVINYVFGGPFGQSFNVLGDKSCYNTNDIYTWRDDECNYQGIVQFNLTGLQPGTTYSLEVRATAPVVQDSSQISNNYYGTGWDTQAAAGDGGWTHAESRQGYYGVATTYLEAAAQNVTRTSADVAVNIQNSHVVDTIDAQRAGYVAVNKCAKDGEGGNDCWNNGYSNVDNPADGTTPDEGYSYSHRFDPTEVSRFPINKTEYVDGQLSAIISLTQLTPDTQYEVAFGLDYWPTGAELYSWYADGMIPNAGAYEPSNRVNFISTLNGVYCNGNWNYDQNEESFDYTDCYNGAQNNDIYRTAVVTFTTGDVDMVDPTLTAVAPANDATDVAVDSDLTLTFSENVVRGSVGHLIKVWNADSASVVATVDVTSAAVSGSGDTWTVSLPDLNYSSNYYVTVDAGAFEDVAGNAFAGLAGRDAKFSTESTDEEGPVLDSIGTVSTWQDGRADTDTTITLNFDENVVGGLGEVQIRKSSNSQIVKTIVPAIYKNITYGDHTAVITLSGVLDYSTEYFVYVAPEAFSDASGNLYGGNAGDIFNEDKPASFTTQDAPDLLGTVAVSKTDNAGYRKYTVNYGAAGSFLAVKLYRKDLHTGVYRYMATVYLDEKGNGSIKLKTAHLYQYDFVVGRVGNHMTSFTIVTTK
jgi:hypothetical protein